LTDCIAEIECYLKLSGGAFCRRHWAPATFTSTVKGACLWIQKS
jgi:hypothetical protein